MLFYFERVLVLLLSILTISSASTCPVFDPSKFNATGSTTFPGFEFDKHNPPLTNNTWRLTTGVSASSPDSATVPQTLSQTLWLDTAVGSTPPLPANPPYTACLIPLSRNASAAGPIHSTTPSSPTCLGLFSSSCHARVLRTATDTILASLLTSPASSLSSTETSRICANFVDAIISNLHFLCPDPSDNAESWAAPVSAAGLFLHHPSCNASSGGSAYGDAEIISIGFDESAAAQGTDSEIPTYEQLVRQPTPLIFTAFQKEANADGTRWVDTRFVCVTADRVRAGSEVASGSAGVRRGGGALGWVLALALAGLGLGVL